VARRDPLLADTHRVLDREGAVALHSYNIRTSAAGRLRTGRRRNDALRSLPITADSDALTRTAAIEHAADIIRVNAVAPTVVLTPMLKQFIADSADPAATQHMVDHFNPMPGVVVPEEFATVVAFIASDDARRITGVTPPGDAGDTAR
jgi:hypothetical protein